MVGSGEETGAHFGREIFRADEVVSDFESLEVSKISILSMEDAWGRRYTIPILCLTVAIA